MTNEREVEVGGAHSSKTATSGAASVVLEKRWASPRADNDVPTVVNNDQPKMFWSRN